MNKYSYFQGASKDKPEEKKKKDEPINQDLTKARGVFFSNYDYAPQESDIGPGAGFYSKMNEYDSVADFRKKKRKDNIRRRRQAMFKAILTSTAKDNSDENHLTDPTEETTTPIPYESAPPGGSPMGLLDGMYPGPDQEDKPISNLYYGRIETHTF